MPLLWPNMRQDGTSWRTTGIMLTADEPLRTLPITGRPVSFPITLSIIVKVVCLLPEKTPFFSQGLPWNLWGSLPSRKIPTCALQCCAPEPQLPWRWKSCCSSGRGTSKAMTSPVKTHAHLFVLCFADTSSWKGEIQTTGSLPSFWPPTRRIC